jgi:hypothetical protein
MFFAGFASQRVALARTRAIGRLLRPRTLFALPSKADSRQGSGSNARLSQLQFSNSGVCRRDFAISRRDAPSCVFIFRPNRGRWRMPGACCTRGQFGVAQSCERTGDRAEHERSATAGSALAAAACPVSPKIPAPMMPPIPSVTRLSAESARLRGRASPCAISSNNPAGISAPKCLPSGW